MLPEGLRASLVIAVSQAFSEKSKIRQRALTCKTKNQEEATFDIVVVPHISAGDHVPTLAMVTIASSEVPSASSDPFSASIAAKEINALRNELELTKQSLKNALDEIQTSNDEQKTINEHLSATNVELQRNNEEFLALNRKLYTKNLEHTNKISELSDLNHDIDEMMNKTSLGVVFLDNELRISRFTDRATNTMHLRPTDMQRPLLHLSHDLQYEHFSKDLNKVLSTGESIDRVVLRNSTVPVHIGIHPYYNERKIPHGIFLTFREISKTELQLRQNIDLDTA
jgi:two-component system CheB/CheR fusion protein